MASLSPLAPAMRAGGLVPFATAGTVLLTGCVDSATPTFPDVREELSCSIPESEIFDGGPGRDGIPSLDRPEIAPASNADILRGGSRVLGVEINGEARAYPLVVMWWHEIVNDTLGGERVTVSYCPLTGSGIAFDPSVGGVARDFGVSGLLFENNLIMFDRETESLWNQLLLGAQCGPERGADLARRPIIETTWGHWRELHPQTTVVTTNTGFDRPYGVYPYGNYDEPNNAVTLFPSSPWSGERPPKELVLGIHEGGDAAAYPFGTLAEHGDAVAVNDSIASRPILVTYWDAARTARAFDRRVDGQTLSFAVADSSTLTLTDDETGSTWNALGEATAGPLAGRQLSPLADAYTLFWFSWSVYYPNTRLLGQ